MNDMKEKELEKVAEHHEWGVVFNDTKQVWQVITLGGYTLIDDIGEFRFRDGNAKKEADQFLAEQIRDNHNASLLSALKRVTKEQEKDSANAQNVQPTSETREDSGDGTQIGEWKEAARELAEFASYAEIVGGITHNREPIRKWCDKVFELIRASAEGETVAVGPCPREEEGNIT